MRQLLAVLVLVGCLLPGTTGSTFCTVDDNTPVFSAPDLHSTVVTLVEKNTCFLGQIQGEWLVLEDKPIYYIHGYTVIEASESAADINEAKGLWKIDPSYRQTFHVRCMDVEGINTCTAARMKPNDRQEKRLLVGEGTWTEWGSWSECNTSACNMEGTRNRSRKCFMLNQNVQAHCEGEPTQIEVCTKTCFVPCSDGFGWTLWQDCRKCAGTTTRMGYCVNGTANVTTSQTKNCTRDLCPVNGTWSEWGPWGTCSATVDLQNGVRFRYRQCLPPIRHGGSGCPGQEFSSGICIGDAWEDWSPWSECLHDNCTAGLSVRMRFCKNNLNCSDQKDKEQETTICYPQTCKFDGSWGAWEGWSVCYCNGFRRRNHQCDSPPPMNGGRDCEGRPFYVELCNRINSDNCPVDGNWTDWTAWTTCSVSCWIGTRTKNRTCTNPPPVYGGEDCGSENKVTEVCYMGPCPVDSGWSMWSNWSSCSTTCQEAGLQLRNRSCDSPPPDHGGSNCTGETEDKRNCTGIGACPVDGGYSEWQPWSNCSVSCNGGVQYRSRKCDHPRPQAGGSNCTGLGKDTDTIICNIQPCPVDGHWAQWSNWSTCDVICGNGTRSRDRQCVGTAHGGQNCTTGDAHQTEICKTVVCSVDGSWGQWAEWSVCNCNNTQTRVRKCDSPAPVGSGQKCSGSSRNETSCLPDPQARCPVDGQWGSWYPWTPCSETCGTGETLRVRSCNNPRPQYGGLYCEGNEEERKQCQEPPCPVDGIWSDWNAWATCSVTCGTGSHYRNRSCDNPAPAHRGMDCVGIGSETENCTMNPCPIDGGWSGWSAWSVCDVTCATGTRRRARTCDSPAPKYGGQPCNGTADEFEQCLEKACPIDGQWGVWQAWTSCSVTCLNGTRSRTRLCDSPEPQNGGSYCAGQQNGTETCVPRENCNVDGGWAEWSLWSVCDVSCATGHHTRYRLCDNPPPENFGKFCEGDDNDVATCFTKPCPIDGKFGDWNAWGLCSPPTGNGLKTRTRLCDSPQPRYGGRNCQGDYTEQLPCCDSQCPVDGGWSQWSAGSDCPVDAGANTTKSRTRTCSQPAPQYGGANCTGGTEETTCCPLNGGWTSWVAWSVCTGDCTSSHRERIHQCNNPRPSCGGRYCVGSGREQDHTCIPDHCTTTTLETMTPAGASGTTAATATTGASVATSATQTSPNSTTTTGTPVTTAETMTPAGTPVTTAATTTTGASVTTAETMTPAGTPVTTSATITTGTPVTTAETMTPAGTPVTTAATTITGTPVTSVATTTAGTPVTTAKTMTPAGTPVTTAATTITGTPVTTAETMTPAGTPVTTAAMTTTGASVTTAATQTSSNSTASTNETTAAITSGTTAAAVTTPTPTKPPQPMQCTVCMVNPALCFALTEVRMCPDSYCISEVTNSADGSKVVDRRCGTLSECENDWWHTTSDDPDCQDYDPAQNTEMDIHCTYCCTTDNCNKDVKPAQDTLYNHPKT